MELNGIRNFRLCGTQFRTSSRFFSITDSFRFNDENSYSSLTPTYKVRATESAKCTTVLNRCRTGHKIRMEGEAPKWLN